MTQGGKRQAHGSNGKDGGSKGGGKDQQKLADDKIEPGNRTRQNGFDRAAFFLTGGEVDGWVHCSREAEQDYGIADKASNTRAANLFRWRHVFLFDDKRRKDACRQILGGQTTPYDRVAIFLDGLLEMVGAKGRLEFPLIEIDINRLCRSCGKGSLEPLGNFDCGANVLVGNLVSPIDGVRNDFQLVEFMQAFEKLRRVLAAENHDFGDFFFRVADHDGREGRYAHHQNGKGEQRHQDGGNQSAAVAQPFGQLFAVHDGDGGKIHGSGLRVSLIGAYDGDKDFLEVVLAVMIA